MCDEATSQRSHKPKEGRYANYFEAGFNSEEIVLDIGQRYGAESNVSFHTRIVTSPVYARELAEVLSEMLETYQSSFGAIGREPLRGLSPEQEREDE